MGLISWLQGRRDDKLDTHQAGLNVIEKFGENLTPNMRALRLAMRVADIMLSMGVAANSVVSRALDITESYCEKPVHIDITSNIIFLSQIRGVDKEPLTLIRPMTERDINYVTLRNVQSLVHRIKEGKLPLDEAEKHLDDIMNNQHQYPTWWTSLSGGVVVAGVTLFYSSSPLVILAGFLIGVVVDRMLYSMERNAVPPFFRQIVVAMTMTLFAAVVHMVATGIGGDWLALNPSLIVVAGIVLLASGMAIVSSMQDAIEEYYLTSIARFTKVMMQTTGMVVGVLIGLYFASRLSIPISVRPDPLEPNTLLVQVLGAFLATVGFSIARQVQIHALPWVGLVGALVFTVFQFSVNVLDFDAVPASGVAAFVAGLVGAIMSRFWHTPSIGIISAGIIPLVPGLMLYRGLMQVTNYPPGDPLFFKAVGTLSTVLVIALFIAAGASLGNLVGRPVHQRLAYARNYSPFMDFIRRQYNPTRRRRLGIFALKTPSDTKHTKEPEEQPDDDQA